MLDNPSGIDLRMESQATGILGEEDICDQEAFWCPVYHATSHHSFPEASECWIIKGPLYSADRPLWLSTFPEFSLFYYIFMFPLTQQQIDNTIFLLKSPVGMHLLPESSSCKPSMLLAFIPNNKTVGRQTTRGSAGLDPFLSTPPTFQDLVSSNSVVSFVCSGAQLCRICLPLLS